MTTSAYKQIIAAPPRDRLDLFLASAYRLGTPVGNIEKDFWVCWTLHVLYHRRPAGAPRLLFKGGTSLSKAYGLRLALDVPDVTTIEACRTFWDKVVITHGLRRWYERRGMLRQEGQRVSRHYYDLHCMLDSATGRTALSNFELAADCVRHARMFFDRTDLDLASAKPGSFAIAPTDGMINTLRRDYKNTVPMIFGTAPAFDEVLASIRLLDSQVNRHKRSATNAHCN